MDPKKDETRVVTDMELFEGRRDIHPVVPVVAQTESPNAVILAAINKNMDPTFIEKIMDLQDRHEKNEARKGYVRAMAAFKAEPPEILKTKHVSYQNSKNQKVEWDHAVLGEIAEAIIKGMSPFGLYHRWDMEQPDKSTVKTTCIITHELGHSESMSMSGPPDTSGGKDELKAISSTNTLFQRLTLLAITGLAAKGMDDENPGNATGKDSEKYDQWVVNCDECAENGIDVLKEWWNKNSKQIKKDCGDADAAKIYKQMTTHIQWLKK